MCQPTFHSGRPIVAYNLSVPVLSFLEPVSLCVCFSLGPDDFFSLCVRFSVGMCLRMPCGARRTYG